MYRKYFVYIDDGKDVYKVAIAAACEDAARAWVQGNGEVIAVKDVTDECHIDAEQVCKALGNAGFDQHKIDFISRLLMEFGVAT